MDPSIIWLSIQISLTSTALAIIIGLPIAWGLSIAKFKGHSILSGLVLLPMLLPPTVLGYYLLQAVGRESVIGQLLESSFGFSIVFHWTGAALAAFVVSVPFLIRSAEAGFSSINRTHKEAAMTLGGSSVSVFIRIILPLAWRSVAAGIAMAFARALGEFGATLMVAGNIPGQTRTMPIAIFEAVQTGRMHEANILTLTLSLIAIGLLLLIGTIMNKKTT
jgi:molybdate transport system permease protein